MKRKLLIAIAVMLAVSAVNAQGVLEAYKYSQRDLRGTARFMSLGGAMGARGGDVSAISINPAGIGMYKSSEVVTTLDLQNTEVKSNFMNSSDQYKESKFKAKFNNLAFVGTIPVYDDVAPLVNFGFSYNKVMSYDKKYRMTGDNLSRRLVDYMADRANHGGRKPGELGLADLNDVGANTVWRSEDWLPVLGYNGFLIEYDDKGKYVPFDTNKVLRSANDLYVEEKGSINTYDFNVGTTFSNIVSAGLTVSVTDIDYEMFSTYVEDFYVGQSGGKDKWNGYDLENGLVTEGTGWKVALGVIVKPIEELRIGIAYHSPTWYNMTDNSFATLYHNLSDLATDPNMMLDKYPKDGGNVKSMSGAWAPYDYKMRTPDRWVFSLSGAIGNIANVSLDYELTDYKKSKFEDRYSGDTDPLVEEYTRNFYRLTSTLRAGVELAFTPKFFGRIGYAWQQNPYSNELRDYLNPKINTTSNFDTPGSVAHYVVDNDTHNFTWGLGYRLTRNVYADLGFIYKTQSADLYTHSMSDVTELKHNTFQGALTLGFRF